MHILGERLRMEFIDGTSHSRSAVRILGLPSGERVEEAELSVFVQRSCPGHSPWTSNRRAPEAIKALKGLQDETLTGGEVLLTLSDSSPTKEPLWQGIPRPGHADFMAYEKWGLHADLTDAGPYGGQRMTLLSAAGGIALQLLERRGIRIAAHIASVGLARDHLFDPMHVDEELLLRLRSRAFPVLEEARGMQMIQRILREKAAGNSVGGSIEACVLGLPRGLGGPWFEGLESRLAAALFGIPAVKGVEFGAGFGVAALTASQHNDPIQRGEEGVTLTSNRAGGILGGMSTGLPLICRCAFKPTPTIALEQETVDLATGEKVVLVGRVEDENRPRGRHEKPLEHPSDTQEERRPGRHEAPGDGPENEYSDGFVDLRTGETVRVVEVGEDLEPCVVPRAVPLVEAVLALVLLDALLKEEEKA